MLRASVLLALLFLSARADAFQDWPRSEFPDPVLKKWIHEYAFPEGNNRPISQNRIHKRTDALVIVHDGKIIFEEYQKGFGPQVPHLLWSVSKSITGILTGIAVQEGLLKKDSLVEDFYPEVKGSGLQIQHLLHWTSGLNWSEEYEYNPVHSRVIQMLFSRGRSDMARFVASQGFKHPPGKKHLYSSGDSTILSGVLQKVWSQDPLYPWTKLFDPLGMKHVAFEKDSAGSFIGSSFMYASAPDLARVGWMLLSNGRWNGKKILDADWISWATQVVPGFDDASTHFKDRWLYPGAQFWLNRKDPVSGLERPWSQVPAGAYFAMGHWGQSMGVFPDDKLVIVRLADDRVFDFNENEFFGTIVQGLRALKAKNL